MNAAPKLRPRMTVEEFLAWPGDGTGTVYELVNGVVRAQDAASDIHGTIQSNLITSIQIHLRAHRPHCRVVTSPGIRPHLRARWNHRIPELGVTCTPSRADVHAMPDPVLLVEILSPSNEADAWSNIALYAAVPSVQEILIVQSTAFGAEILRRGGDGSWPREPESIAAGGDIHLQSIGLILPLSEAYRSTHLLTEPA